MKKSLLRHVRVACGLVLFVTAGAHAGNPPPKNAASASAGLHASILVAVGDAACDGPQHCRSIAIGAKPCGGPDGFLAWSTKRTDEKQLRSLLEQHAAARKQENLRDKMMSTCEMETNPGATCQAGRCTLGPRGQGSLPADPSCPARLLRPKP